MVPEPPVGEIGEGSKQLVTAEGLLPVAIGAADVECADVFESKPRAVPFGF